MNFLIILVRFKSSNELYTHNYSNREGVTKGHSVFRNFVVKHFLKKMKFMDIKSVYLSIFRDFQIYRNEIMF